MAVIAIVGGGVTGTLSVFAASRSENSKSSMVGVVTLRKRQRATGSGKSKPSIEINATLSVPGCSSSARKITPKTKLAQPPPSDSFGKRPSIFEVTVKPRAPTLGAVLVAAKVTSNAEVPSPSVVEVVVDVVVVLELVVVLTEVVVTNVVVVSSSFVVLVVATSRVVVTPATVVVVVSGTVVVVVSVLSVASVVVVIVSSAAGPQAARMVVVISNAAKKGRIAVVSVECRISRFTSYR
ncbi:MAG: hypothetical protein ACI8TX_002457 [Hyphomicrobiaceae bacterium]|jgi:hypothetical protein